MKERDVTPSERKTADSSAQIRQASDMRVRGVRGAREKTQVAQHNTTILCHKSVLSPLFFRACFIIGVSFVQTERSVCMRLSIFGDAGRKRQESEH